MYYFFKLYEIQLLNHFNIIQVRIVSILQLTEIYFIILCKFCPLQCPANFIYEKGILSYLMPSMTTFYVSYDQFWEGYSGNVTGYRLQVTLLKR